MFGLGWLVVWCLCVFVCFVVWMFCSSCVVFGRVANGLKMLVYLLFFCLGLEGLVWGGAQRARPHLTLPPFFAFFLSFLVVCSFVFWGFRVKWAGQKGHLTWPLTILIHVLFICCLFVLFLLFGLCLLFCFNFWTSHCFLRNSNVLGVMSIFKYVLVFAFLLCCLIIFSQVGMSYVYVVFSRSNTAIDCLLLWILFSGSFLFVIFVTLCLWGFVLP